MLENKDVWEETDKKCAHSIIMHVLTENYGLIEDRIPESVATTLTASFMNIFSINPRYFSNGKYYFDGDSYKLKMSTVIPLYGRIEGGVICFDEKFIGIIWVVDDD